MALCYCPLLCCLSPRLLVSLGPECDFTPQDLQKEIDLLIISVDQKNVEETINQLDRTSSTHITLIDGPVEDYERLSRRVGYDFITLNESFEPACKTLKSFIADVPLTEADLPRIDPKSVGQFYDLMMKVDTIFSRHRLPYCGTCGTLLGLVRHGGMIPWDDDIDVAIRATNCPLLESLQPDLNEVGLELYYYPIYDFYKIFPKDGLPITKGTGEELYPWKYPFLDIFPLIEKDGKITYRYEGWQQYYPTDYFLPEEFTFVDLPFGPMKLPSPVGSLNYLRRMYGEAWNDVAYVKYSHRHEKSVKKVRVDLIDRSPPLYILP
jgi:lipopolysaccharide cholinephosphotransferase